MHTPLNKIKSIVKEKIGLDSSTIGDSTIEKIIQQRMHQCNLKDFDDYYLLITNNDQELSELLEVTVIPETWFFRDIKPFETIYKKIKQKLVENRSSTFKILSIPSSTGEEPYSLAMYLIDKGIDISRFNIDAVDVSTRALQCAEKGLYGNNSFRGKHYSAYQEKHFSKEGDFYKIHSDINRKVNFYRLNILKSDQALKQKFDYILCRNLLIYFDAPTKLTAFKNLFNFLKDNGHLFIGHSEFGSVPDNLFKNTGFEHAFALVKHNNPDYEKKPQTEAIETTPVLPKKQQKTAQPFKQKKAFESLIKQNIINKPEEDQTTPSSILKQIRKLADSGEYLKAEEICQQNIASNGENDETLFLLGLIKGSQNENSQAETLFRKALFLNPKHYDSLIHLSLLLKKSGDNKNSDLLRIRAEKSKLSNKE